jgi:nitrogen fixation NifU-like protein
MDLKELYRDVILDHNRHPRNFGRLENAGADVRHADGHNPLCFDGSGCAISTASASLMTEAVKGKERAAVRKLFDEVHTLLTRHDAEPGAALGKLAALSGVREFPVRVKCATLSWHTLNAALESGAATVSTE